MRLARFTFPAILAFGLLAAPIRAPDPTVNPLWRHGPPKPR